MDHDAGSDAGNIIPTVTLVCDIPPLASQSFFRGRVVTRFKNAVLQPSTAMRATAELDFLLRSLGEYTTKSVLIMTSDGGHEHNMRNGSVRVSLCALFKSANLDLLVSVRSAPMHSWRNRVERCMAIANLALNGMALERKRVAGGGDSATRPGEENGWEEKARKCGFQGQVRELIAQEAGFGAAYLDSFASVTRLLEERFERLLLKDHGWRCLPALQPQEIESVFAAMEVIDPELKMEETIKVQLDKHKPFNDFIASHAVVTRSARGERGGWGIRRNRGGKGNLLRVPA